MWSSYKKVFVFRDCFDKKMNEGNIEAINKLLSVEQSNGSKGSFIVTELLSVGLIANTVETYTSEDDGTLNIVFYNNVKEVEVAQISLWNDKEVHLVFDIEEEIETNKIQIHYCVIEGFKEYQN